MTRVDRLAFWGLPLAALWACSSSSAGGPDASPDAGPDQEDGGPEIVRPAPPEPPAPPVFTPCPDGWREVTDDDLTTCDPWPEGGALTCADDEAHFPGEPGCRRIGSACPETGWPEVLPDGASVLWVRAGSVSGDGSQTSPFGSIGEAVTASVEGSVIAVAVGEYDEAVRLGKVGLVLVGACASGTRIAASTPSSTAGTITVSRADVEIRNLSIGGARPGIRVSATGAVRVVDVVVSHAEEFGIFLDEGALSAQGLVVRETLGRRSDGQFGRGIEAEFGAQLEIVGGVIERNREIGLFAGAAGTSVTLSDVAISDTRDQQSDGAWGIGLMAQDGAEVSVTRGAFERNREVGLIAGAPSTILRLTDAVVRDTRGRLNDGASGRGLSAQGGAQVEATRVVIERNREYGVYAVDPETTMVLSDVSVSDTESLQSEQNEGHGLGGWFGAHVEVSRAVLQRNRGLGVHASDPGTTVTLTDVTVRDTRSEEIDGHLGRGLLAQFGALVEVTRAVLQRNRDSGVSAFGEGTVVRLSDVAVLDTLDQECEAEGTCRWSATSHVGSYDAAVVEVRRFLLERSAFLGVQLASVPAELGGGDVGGTINLHEGVVADNPIGINIQTEGFDLARIRDRVIWGPNTVNLVTDELPVPEPSPSGG